MTFLGKDPMKNTSLISIALFVALCTTVLVSAMSPARYGAIKISESKQSAREITLRYQPYPSSLMTSVHEQKIDVIYVFQRSLCCCLVHRRIAMVDLSCTNPYSVELPKRLSLIKFVHEGYTTSYSAAILRAHAAASDDICLQENQEGDFTFCFVEQSAMSKK